MTKSTITREESVQAVFDLKVGYRLGFADIEILKRVARMALAAMDSEPVAWIAQNKNTGEVEIDEPFAKATNPKYWTDSFPVYRHTQPAPAVQCPFPCGWENLNKLAIQDAAFVARGLVEGEPTTEAQRQAAISNNYRLLKVISACRAAMLAADPHDTPALNSVQSVVTVPGKWIPVSERMPESNGVYFGWDGKRVLEVYCFFGGFSANQFIHGEITHWMPLPAAPQEAINALIPLVSRNEREVK